MSLSLKKSKSIKLYIAKFFSCTWSKFKILPCLLWLIRSPVARCPSLSLQPDKEYKRFEVFGPNTPRLFDSILHAQESYSRAVSIKPIPLGSRYNSPELTSCKRSETLPSQYNSYFSANTDLHSSRFSIVGVASTVILHRLPSSDRLCRTRTSWRNDQLDTTAINRAQTVAQVNLPRLQALIILAGSYSVVSNVQYLTRDVTLCRIPRACS